MADPTMNWSDFGNAVAAIGAFGTAAFGIVESLGKVISFSWTSNKGKTCHNWGLPYAGFRDVKRMMKPLRPALKYAYGDDYMQIISQQYRTGGSTGSAPDTIRQGVRLGLPFMTIPAATKLIDALWDLDIQHATALATALQSPVNLPPPDGAAPPAPDATAQGQVLAGRFSTTLDARIGAAFDLADQRYETTAKTLAGMVAVGLSLAFNEAFPLTGTVGPQSVLLAIGIGLVAVPIAPVVNDLSTNLQNALTAFRSISGKH
jgi:hypothetical protein